MPIATQHPGARAEMGRKVLIPEWTERCDLARTHEDHWTLSGTVTDLAVSEAGELQHGPFDAPGPGTIRWLHHRLVKTHGQVDDPLGAIRCSLAGVAERVNDNGLGFDATRFSSMSDVAEKTIDPVVEVLAFFALRLLPVRGPGVDGKYARAAQRGWDRSTRRQTFRYATWRSPLAFPAIDALLDLWHGDPVRAERMLLITSAWTTRSYETKTGETATSAYGAVRVR